MIRNCRVLKQSELNALEKALNNILLDWCDDWLPNSFYATVTNIKPLMVRDEKNKQLDAEYFAAWSNDSWCAVLSDCCDVELVGKALLGHKPNKNDRDMQLGPTSQSIVDDALLELIQRVVAGGNVSIDAVPVKLSKQTPVTTDAFQPWSGAIVVNISIADARIRLMLSGSVIENIIPRQVTGMSKITIERDVVINGIKDKKIKAQVRLKPANLSIGTLANLSPGDVVVLEHKVDCPFNLIISDSKKYCTGYLGMRNGNYALRLDSSEQITS